MILSGRRSQKSRNNALKLVLAVALLAAVPTLTRHFAFAAGRGLMCGRAALGASRVACLAETVDAEVASAQNSAAPQQTVDGAGGATKQDQVEIVKITNESSMTTAGVLAFIPAWFVGGLLLGLPVFAVASWLARKEDGAPSQVLKGVATGALQAINSSAGAVTAAVESAKAKPDTKEVAVAVSNFYEGATNFDKDVGVVKAVGDFTTETSKLSARAVEKAAEAAKAKLSEAGVELPK